VAVVGFTNLDGGDANKAYYEAEVAEAAQEEARTRLAAYYAMPMAARWVSLSGRLAPDGAEIAPGEISRAFDGYAPRTFTAQDRNGQPIETGAVADRLDAPNRRAGTDMTVSQPKSYSALVAMAELAGEAALARDLREARHQVVREVVKHALDIGLVQTRRGHGGREVETPADVMVAVIPHSKSRAGDPQEHDHVLFFNGSLRADGTVGTLDLSRLVSHKFYLQALVASGMADRMQRLGFAVQEAGRGRWELAGAPDALLKAWSQRRAEVVAGLHGTAADLARTQAAAEQAAHDGTTPEREDAAPAPARGATQARREAMQASALKSRRAKDEMPDAAALTARHREDLDRLGLTPDGVIDHMRAVAPHTPVPDGQPAEVALAALFARTSVATMRQVRTAIAEAAAVRGMRVAEVEAEVRQAIDGGAAKAIGVAPGGEAVFSTDQAIRTERAMLVAARDGQGQGLLTPAAAERAMAQIEAREQAGGRADFAFAPEQRQAVLHAARGDQFVVLEGVAGAGKTTSMQAVVSAAQAMGMRTIGVAPTNAAAETLRAETKADEHLSLQKLATEIATKRRVLTRRDYVLVDEAGMAELADVAALVQAARAGGAQVAFVGDERQFAPIGSGAPFAALGSVLGSSCLTEIRRQRTPWQTEASRRMAAGDSEAGTLAYAAEGRWTFGQHRADTFARLKADWTADLDRAPAPGQARASRLVVAQRNEDVHALNAELRQVLLDRGVLGREETTVRTLHRDGGAGDVRDLPLRAGDELIVWRRVPSHNLNNGDRLTVLGFQPMPGTATGDVLLTWRVEKSGTVVTAPLSSLEAPPVPDDPAGQPRVPYLQHGYAVSMYASQSKTVDRGFVFGGTGLDARSTYVALTRHRDDARVYWDRGAIAQELAEQGERPTRAAVVGHIRREARRVTEARSVLDFVPDADAWLATGDVAAERSRPSAVAARMAAASQTAAATVLQATETRPDQVAALAGGAQDLAAARSRVRPPRTAPEVRAAAVYARDTSRIQEAAAVRDRRAMARVDAVVQALKQPGAVRAVVAGLRDVPRRVRDVQQRATRTVPTAGEAVLRWTRAWRQGERAAQLDARRQEVDGAGQAALRGVTALAPEARQAAAVPEERMWTEHWLWRSRLGRFAPDAPVLAPQPEGHAAAVAKVAVLPPRIAATLGVDALAALARPTLGEAPAQARTVSAGAYAETLERERAILAERIVAGVARTTGKPTDQVRGELAAAQARPQSLENVGLRAGVERLNALAMARGEVAGAIAEGRLRVTAPILALDPHASPTGWRVELRRAMQATGDHAPPPDPKGDRAVLDGRTVTVGDAAALLRARRAALGVPEGIPAALGSGAALLDGAIGTLREAVAEGRLSARAPIAAVPPAERKGWRAAFRDAAAETARRAGAGARLARAHGQQAASYAYERDRALSQTAQALRARDAHAPAAERAIEAMWQAERAAAARAEEARRQAQRPQPAPSPSRGISM